MPQGYFECMQTCSMQIKIWYLPNNCLCLCIQHMLLSTVSWLLGQERTSRYYVTNRKSRCHSESNILLSGIAPWGSITSNFSAQISKANRNLILLELQYIKSELEPEISLSKEHIDLLRFRRRSPHSRERASQSVSKSSERGVNNLWCITWRLHSGTDNNIARTCGVIREATG